MTTRTLAAAVRDIRRFPMRSLLVALSLGLGVFAFTGITTASSLSRDALVANEEQANGRAPSYSQPVLLPVIDGAAVSRVAEEVGRRNDTQGQAVVATVEAPVSVGIAQSSGDATEYTTVTGLWMEGDPAAIRRIPLVEGRWSHDEAELPPRAVANLAAARAFGGVGTVMSVVGAVDGRPHLVVIEGIVADGRPDAALLGSLGLGWRLGAIGANGAATPTPLVLSIHAPALGQARAASILSDLAFDVGAKTDEPMLRTDSVKDIEDGLAATRRSFLAAAVLALVIASIGIVNIGLASVRERSRELTIRRAVGASSAGLFAVVLLAAVLIALVVFVVTCAAVAMAVTVVSWRLSPESPLQAPHFPWGAARSALVTSLVTAALGAAVPAAIAARATPADVLRGT